MDCSALPWPVVRYCSIGRRSVLNVYMCEESFRSTVQRCVSSSGSVARSSINIILRNMLIVCAPVYSAVFLCHLICYSIAYV